MSGRNVRITRTTSARIVSSSQMRERLLGRLRVAEVDRAGEELLAAVDAPRREQLMRADDAERFPLLGADEVLAAVARA